ncbi:hypothetical protein G9A89_014570 [Geosiphon pyriformis]|nr:hypothetical protein G9A89_014570 [Geosiphon pyriformis]
MSSEVVLSIEESVEDIPNQTLVSSSIVVPSTSTARRSTRYGDEQHPKRRASDEGSRRKLEENKRPRLNIKDGELKRRGQRMFGMILGTLTKFKNDSQNKTEAEMKREQIDQKLQKKLKKDKEELLEKMKKEDQEKRDKIAKQRKEEEERRQSQLRDCWLNQQKNLANYLSTSTEPHLYYLPARLSSRDLETIAEQKRQLALASTSVGLLDVKPNKEEYPKGGEDTEMEEQNQHEYRDPEELGIISIEKGEDQDENFMEVDQMGDNTKIHLVPLVSKENTTLESKATYNDDATPVSAIKNDVAKITGNHTTNEEIGQIRKAEQDASLRHDVHPTNKKQSQDEEDISMKEGEPEEIVEY